MRVQAKLAGVPHASLFGESPFVLRASAERWVKEAHSEGWDDARAVDKENTRALERIAKDHAEGKPSPFAHLNTENFRQWQQYETDPSKCSAAYLEERHRTETMIALSKLCKAQGLEFSEVFGPGSLASSAQMAMAERIVAGANRRDAVVNLAERKGIKK